MRSPAISLDQLASLPAVYRAVIPPAYEDRNGHMNMRWYLAIYDEAGNVMYPMLGLTADYFAAWSAGGFDLEHHLWYFSEVRIGDTVVIRARILARSLKLFHYMMFMGNESQGMLSSLFECVHAHADLRARRTAPFPAQVVAGSTPLSTSTERRIGPRRSRGPWASKQPPASEIMMDWLNAPTRKDSRRSIPTIYEKNHGFGPADFHGSLYQVAAAHWCVMDLGKECSACEIIGPRVGPVRLVQPLDC